jgi:hypothetical protein
MFITKTWPTRVSLTTDAGGPTMPGASNSLCLAGSVSNAKTSCRDADAVTVT